MTVAQRQRPSGYRFADLTLRDRDDELDDNPVIARSVSGGNPA